MTDLPFFGRLSLIERNNPHQACSLLRRRSLGSLVSFADHFRLKDTFEIPSQQAPLHLTQSDDGGPHPSPQCAKVSMLILEIQSTEILYVLNPLKNI